MSEKIMTFFERILRDDKTRKSFFSGFVLCIMLLINVPIIFREAFGQRSFYNISPILSLWFPQAEVVDIKIPYYQFSAILTFIEAFLIIYGAELVSVGIAVIRAIAYKIFGINLYSGERNERGGQQ